MSEDEGPQYAMHVALNTLKDRCKWLQNLVDNLEKENLKLKMQCMRTEVPGSLNEVDELKTKIVKLTEQKGKLRRDMMHVALENKELWGKLSKILEINKSLGSHLTKINDSINQHSRKALIRSTTFTQSDADAKNVNKAISENSEISLELQDISLKLISNIVKEKAELETQCSEMTAIQKSFSDSLNFAYFDDSDDSLAEDFEQHITDLKTIKEKLNEQNKTLEKAVINVQSLKDDCNCNNDNIAASNRDRDDFDDEIQLQSLARWGTPENSNTFLHLSTKESKNYCPMCTKEFPNSAVNDFVQHVESHFKL